jgi:hypothetical protein
MVQRCSKRNERQKQAKNLISSLVLDGLRTPSLLYIDGGGSLSQCIFVQERQIAERIVIFEISHD